MSHAVPYPSLATSDVDYVSKMQANLDYLRDQLILQNLTGTDISSTAGFASGQIAQYGIAGSSLNTGASGVPTAALQTGSVTEPKYGTASIVEADIDYTSVKIVRAGTTGIKIVRGSFATTGTVGPGTATYTIDVTDPATSGAYESTTITQTTLAFATPRFTADPSKPYNVYTGVVGSSTQITITFAAPESISIVGIVYWMAFGT